MAYSCDLQVFTLKPKWREASVRLFQPAASRAAISLAAIVFLIEESSGIVVIIGWYRR
jgi:ribosomal protein L18E